MKNLRHQFIQLKHPISDALALLNTYDQNNKAPDIIQFTEIRGRDIYSEISGRISVYDYTHYQNESDQLIIIFSNGCVVLGKEVQASHREIEDYILRTYSSLLSRYLTASGIYSHRIKVLEQERDQYENQMGDLYRRITEVIQERDSRNESIEIWKRKKLDIQRLRFDEHGRLRFRFENITAEDTEAEGEDIEIEFLELGVTLDGVVEVVDGAPRHHTQYNSEAAHPHQLSGSSVCLGSQEADVRIAARSLNTDELQALLYKFAHSYTSSDSAGAYYKKWLGESMEDEDERVYSEYHDQWYHQDEVVYSESMGDYISDDRAVWSEYEQSYLIDDDAVTAYGRGYVLDTNAEYNEIREEYVLTDDIYARDRADNPLHRDFAVQLYDGEFADLDDEDLVETTTGQFAYSDDPNLTQNEDGSYVILTLE